jgi:hypothetical protein
MFRGRHAKGNKREKRKQPQEKSSTSGKKIKLTKQTSEFESYFYYGKVCFDLYKIF